MVDDIVNVVAGAAPEIREGLPGRRVYESEENPSGEAQLAADVYADELLEERLLDLDSVATYASEERESVVEGDGGTYHVACDPLDGSSNLKSNNPMGTVFAVYDRPLPAAGDAVAAAGYVLFGPITTMVVAREGAASEYLVDGDGNRELLAEDLRLPEDPTVYGFGGRVPDWPDEFASFVEGIEDERLKLRYGGAMVADVAQVVTYGGLFGYPGLVDRPEGKLRLLFEGAPIAYVVESMGGASTDGERSLLAKEPAGLHERTPVHVGNESLVDRLEDALSD